MYKLAFTKQAQNDAKKMMASRLKMKADSETSDIVGAFTYVGLCRGGFESRPYSNWLPSVAYWTKKNKRCIPAERCRQGTFFVP